MKLGEKYISASQNAKAPDPNKVELSDDAYALCEFLESLERAVRLHG